LVSGIKIEGEAMSFTLPNCFQGLHSPQAWGDVFFINHGSTTPRACVLTTNGPFLRLEFSEDDWFYLFAVSFTPTPGTLSESCTLVFPFNPALGTVYRIDFSSPSGMIEFHKFYYQQLQMLELLAHNLPASIIDLAGHLICLLPGEERTHKCTAKVCRTGTKYSFSVRSKSSRKSGFFGKSKRWRDLNFELGLHVMVATGMKLPKAFGSSVSVSQSFRVFYNRGKEFWAVAPTADSALKWVLMVYIATVRSQSKRISAEPRPVESASLVDIPTAIAPLSDSVISRQTSDFGASTSQDDILSQPAHREPGPFAVTQFEVSPVPVDAPAAVSPEEVIDLSALQDEIIVGPWQGLEDVERARDRLAQAELRQLKAKPRGRRQQRPPRFSDEKPRATFLPGRPPSIELRKRFESRKPRRPIPLFALPGVEYFGFAAATVNTSPYTQLTARLIDQALLLVPDSDPEIRPWVVRSTSDMVKETMAKLSRTTSVDFSFFDFTPFPDFDRAGFLEPREPTNQLLVQLSEVNGQIRQTGAIQLSMDDEPARLLTRLLASLFLNGRHEQTDIIAALRSFQGKLDLGRILDRASQYPEAHRQASVIAAWLLNTANAILLVKLIAKHPQWTEQNYRRSAQIASEVSVDFFVTLVSPIVNQCEFALKETPDLLVDWDPHLICSFVTTPAFPYVELAFVRTRYDLVT
jgi:hypothetical protein